MVSIFYSWQSEHPKDVNRQFISKALKKAIEAITKEYKLDESPRLEHDTKGIPGLPDITHTIFSKIEKSSVFVGDVSFTSISMSKADRLCPNPNVLIELGFALKALGAERVILVINDAFGSPKDNMPFNLAGRRWPVTYTLFSNADKETEKKAFLELTGKLKNALKVMADNNILFSSPTITTPSIHSDRLLFSKFLEQFPYNSNMMILLGDDVGASFPTEWLKEIDDFIQQWDNAFYEFIDSILKVKQKDFMRKLIYFKDELWLHTWQTGNSDMRSMELYNCNDTHPRWNKRKELNTIGTEARDAHQELVRTCKVVLGYPE